MSNRIITMIAITGFLASACLASDCSTNFRRTPQGTETRVEIADRTPEAVILRLSARLQAGGVAMETSEPSRGILHASGLTVLAEPAGLRTRVTFRSSVSADPGTLCRYTTMLDDPPLTNRDVLRLHDRALSDEELIRRIETSMDTQFDLTDQGLASLRAKKLSPAVIASMIQRDGAKRSSVANADTRTPAQIRADLIARKKIGGEYDRAVFDSEASFLEFAILSSRPIASDMREYVVSMVLPRAAVQIAAEQTDAVEAGFMGQRPTERTGPVRVEAILHYRSEGGAYRLTGAEIRRMKSLPGGGSNSQ